MAPLVVGPGTAHALPHDLGIDREKGLADGPDKGEIALPVAAVEIIEEDPAGAARLAAMLQEEILVAPRLEALMAIRVVAVAGGGEGGMKHLGRLGVGIN